MVSGYLRLKARSILPTVDMVGRQSVVLSKHKPRKRGMEEEKRDKRKSERTGKRGDVWADTRPRYNLVVDEDVKKPTNQIGQTDTQKRQEG